MEEELQKILKTENGYYVYSASEWLEEMNKMINMVIVILTGIASISLLVGGIGHYEHHAGVCDRAHP